MSDILKRCSKCKIIQPVENFSPDKRKLNGLRNQCKKCVNAQAKIQYAINPNKKKEYQKANSEKRKAYLKEYHNVNSDRLKVSKRVYENKKRKTDINYRLCCNLRRRLCNSIRNNYKAGSAVTDLGCSIEELKNYLEKQFQPDMTWDNWALDGWHIDHKIALSNFDLSDREQLLKAVNYTNLQPLWAKDNIRKGNKDYCSPWNFAERA